MLVGLVPARTYTCAGAGQLSSSDLSVVRQRSPDPDQKYSPPILIFVADSQTQPNVSTPLNWVQIFCHSLWLTDKFDGWPNLCQQEILSARSPYALQTVSLLLFTLLVRLFVHGNGSFILFSVYLSFSWRHNMAFLSNGNLLDAISSKATNVLSSLSGITNELTKCAKCQSSNLPRSSSFPLLSFRF